MDLPRITLAGWNGTLPARSTKLTNLVLDDLDFQRAHLQGINLSQAYCSRINLSAAKVFGADFSYSHMQRADMRWLEAPFAVFNGTRMQGSLLDGAILFGAKFVFADMRGASLDGAQLQFASFDSAKLEGARLLNITLNEETDFSHATADSTTVIAFATPKPGKYDSSSLEFPTDFDVDVTKTESLRMDLQNKGLIFR